MSTLLIAVPLIVIAVVVGCRSSRPPPPARAADPAQRRWTIPSLNSTAGTSSDSAGALDRGRLQLQERASPAKRRWPRCSRSPVPTWPSRTCPTRPTSSCRSATGSTPRRPLSWPIRRASCGPASSARRRPAICGPRWPTSARGKDRPRADRDSVHHALELPAGGLGPRGRLRGDGRSRQLVSLGAATWSQGASPGMASGSGCPGWARGWRTSG